MQATPSTAAPPQQRPADLLRNRYALAAMFFINGALFANWAARIPDVQARIGLTEGTLGLALLGMSVGVVSGLPLAGGMIGRFSSRTVTVVMGLFYCFVMPLLGLAGSFWALWAALFAFGFGTSTMDVAMNAQAVAIERRYQKPIMSSFHAMWSIGTALGAGAGALFAQFDVAPLQHFTLVTALGIVVVVVAGFGLIGHVEGEQDAEGTVFSFPPRALWLLGAVAFCGAIGEGTAADWSAVYLREIVGAEAGAAGLGFTVFAVLMTVGRLSGDWLTTRFDPATVVRLGGISAATGMTLIIFVPQYTMVLVGFALIGLGLATVIPLAFSSAGNRDDIPSSKGIAGVATIAYSGFLAGPPVIGIVAEHTSLRVAFGIVLVLFVLMSVNAHALRRGKAKVA